MIGPSRSLQGHLKNVRDASSALDVETSAQPYLWTGPSIKAARERSYLSDWNVTTTLLNNDHWVSSFPAVTNTGFLTSSVQRLNSTLSCSSIDFSSFESSCNGNFPWHITHSHDDNRYGETRGPLLSLSACMPGDFRFISWNDTNDRQDLTEHLFLAVTANKTASVDDSYAWLGTKPIAPKLAYHCTASTTRGWFELPSDSNGNLAGPLIPNPSAKDDLGPYMPIWGTKYAPEHPETHSADSDHPPPILLNFTDSDGNFSNVLRSQISAWFQLYADDQPPLLTATLVLLANYTSLFSPDAGEAKYWFRFPLQSREEINRIPGGEMSY